MIYHAYNEIRQKKGSGKNIKHNLRNRTYRSALKTQMKKFLSVVKEGNAQVAQEELRLTVKKIDKGVVKGILHKKIPQAEKSRDSQKA